VAALVAGGSGGVGLMGMDTFFEVRCSRGISAAADAGTQAEKNELIDEIDDGIGSRSKGGDRTVARS